MKRRILAAVTVSAVLLLLAVPAGATEADEERGVGTATTEVSLATLLVEGLLVDIGTVDLGSLATYASTATSADRNPLGQGEPFAQAVASLPVVGDVAVRSDGDTTDPGQTVALPGGIGSVTVGAMEASTAAESATALIDALSGALDVGVGDVSLLDVTAALPDAGALTVVDATSATATNGAVLEGLELGLTDLLPLDLLEQLPLSVLLDLVDQLPVDLDAVLDELRTQIRALVADLQELIDAREALEGLLDEIDVLEAELDDLLGELADLDDVIDELTDAVDDVLDAEDAVAAAEGAVAAAEGALAPVLDTVSTTLDPAEACADPTVRAAIDLIDPTLCPALEDALDDLGDAQALLAAAETALADLENTLGTTLEDALDARAALDAAITLVEQALSDLLDLVDELVDTLVELIEDILDLLDEISVSDLLDLVEGLLDGLAGLDLLDIGRVNVSVESIATATGSSAAVTCTVVDTSVLGESTDTCEALAAALDGLATTLIDVLSELPVTEAVGGAVSVGGLTSTTTETDAKDGETYVAESAVDALVVAVDSIELSAVTDTLVADIEALLDGILDELAALIGDLDGDLDLFSSAGFQQVDAGDLDDLIAALEPVLETLRAELEALDLPTELAAGLATPELGVTALGVGSGSSFTATGATAPTTPGTPAVPTTPTAAPQLPQTGGGIALALLLLLAGAGLAAGTRRTRPGTGRPPSLE